MHWKCVLAVTRCKQRIKVCSQRTGVHQKETSLGLSKGKRLVLSEVLSKSLDLLMKEQLTALVLKRPGQK